MFSPSSTIFDHLSAGQVSLFIGARSPLSLPFFFNETLSFAYKIVDLVMNMERQHSIGFLNASLYTFLDLTMQLTQKNELFIGLLGVLEFGIIFIKVLAEDLHSFFTNPQILFDLLPH